MTRDDIKKMLSDSYMDVYSLGKDHDKFLSRAEHFAALIEKHLSYDGIHTCHNECQRPACVATRRAVEREREACAKVVEEYPHWIGLTAKAEISNAIRARGQA
jgi:hypothetical protein